MEIFLLAIVVAFFVWYAFFQGSASITIWDVIGFTVVLTMAFILWRKSQKHLRGDSSWDRRRPGATERRQAAARERVKEKQAQTKTPKYARYRGQEALARYNANRSRSNAS